MSCLEVWGDLKGVLAGWRDHDRCHPRQQNGEAFAGDEGIAIW
jgi:hypothetical protein